MKKRQRTEDSSSRWSNEEMDVAHILGSLPRCRTWFFIGQMPYNPTGKRSAIQTKPFLPPPPPQPPAAVAPPCNPAVASSPNTPLSFPVTESDEKTEPRKKSSLKRKKEYYLNVVESLTNTKESLSQELQNLMRNHEELKDINLKLKAREQELFNVSKSAHKNPNWEIGQTSGSIKSLKSTAENESQKQQQQMQMANQNRNFGTHNGEGVVQFHHMFGPTTSLQMVSSDVDNNQGPLLLPDLNMSIEESSHMESCQPLDENKANKDMVKAMAAAQARQRRLQILRLKKPSQSHR